MPHSLSATKRVRQNEKRRLLNKAVRTNVRTAIKRVKTVAAAGNAEAAKEAYVAMQKKLDQAVAKGVFHKNTANRHKSRLAHLIAGATGSAQ